MTLVEKSHESETVNEGNEVKKGETTDAISVTYVHSDYYEPRDLVKPREDLLVNESIDQADEFILRARESSEFDGDELILPEGLDPAFDSRLAAYLLSLTAKNRPEGAVEIGKLDV